MRELAEGLIGERLRRRVQAEDIVQSVFLTFFQREYSVDHSLALWRLLAQITRNKVLQKGQHHGAGKRDLTAEIHADGGQIEFEAIARGPGPEEAAASADELEFLLDGLEEPEPEMVRLRLQGLSAHEIGIRVGRSRWTVSRVLDRVGDRLRQRWEVDSGNY